MPYCQRCGTNVREEMAFCPKCGASLKVEKPPAPAVRRDEKAEKREKREKEEKGEKEEKVNPLYIKTINKNYGSPDIWDNP